MRARFQPSAQYSLVSGVKAVAGEINRLPALPLTTLTRLLSPFLEKNSVETSVLGSSAGGTGLIRVIVRDQTLPGNVLRLGLFGGLEPSGLEVISHLSPYLESTLKRKKHLRAEIRTYPLSYPGAWLPQAKGSGSSILPELWNGSLLPDAYYLERELAVYRFNLAVTLHRSSDEKFHLATSSRVIHESLLAPVRQATLQKFRRATDKFPAPSLRDPSSAKLVSPGDLGTNTLEISLHVPPGSNSSITLKILEELEQQYPALLAYQAFI